VLGWVVGYGASWVLLAVAFTLFIAAFVPSALGESRHLGGAVAASYLGGYFFLLAPAGLGAREILMGGLLAGVPDMPGAGVVALPIFSRLWFTLGELAPLALVPLMGRSTHEVTP
jgi:hypothetical protein